MEAAIRIADGDGIAVVLDRADARKAGGALRRAGDMIARGRADGLRVRLRVANRLLGRVLPARRGRAQEQHHRNKSGMTGGGRSLPLRNQRRDRKSTRLNSSTNTHLVLRL